MKLSNTQFYLSRFDAALDTEPPLSSIDDSPLLHSDREYVPEDTESLIYTHPVDKSQTRSETEGSMNSSDELEIRVEGIPDTGAKSRVETQIRLSIQLTSKNGVKVPYWSYLRINESMLAKSKLKKSQYQKLLDGTTAAMVSDESRVLDLEARVVCESDENKIIKMCQGCVRRERKRAERKKNSKPTNYKLNSNVVDEKFESDRERVLIFNCESLVNFSKGEAILPTRITCYCRHHNERIGFRVRFTVKNSQGTVIATGDTPPVMITDDHKSSKQGTSFITAHNSRKRPRNNLNEYGDESDVMTTPASSRRNSFSGSEVESETNQTCASSPSTPTVNDSFSISFDANTGEALNKGGIESIFPRTPDTPNFLQNVMDVNSYNVLPGFEVPDPHQQEITSYPIMLQENEFGEHDALPPTRRRRRLNDSSLLDTCNPSFLSTSNTQQQLNYNESFFEQDPATGCLTSNSPEPLNSLSPSQGSGYQQSPQTAIPILNSVSPSQGPTLGGVEITLKGEGFHQDLTVMFGNRAATTVCCSPTFMVCILPPTDKNEAVLISFKDHSLLRSSEMPASFEYFEQSESELIDLSIQAVGSQNNTKGHLSPQNVESEVLQILSGSCFPLSSHTNAGGQNLLHLASYYNLGHLMNYLMRQYPDMVHSIDKNGLTPLHFACLKKSTQAISALVKYGASVSQASSIGTPMDTVANVMNSLELQQIERQIHQGGVNILSIDELSYVPWIPNIFVYAAVQSCQQINSTSFEPFVTCFSTQQQPTVINSMDTLFYNF